MFEDSLRKADHVVVLTGAGISAESGIPTFRGEGGLWRNFKAQELATPHAFRKNPSLVWQFYQYRRDIVFEKKPNNGHYALVDFEKKLLEKKKKFTLITQNVDGYHILAGSKNVIEMHGNIIETRCTKCHNIERTFEKLVDVNKDKIENDELPICKKNKCGGLLRPNVVWFEESLNPENVQKIDEEIRNCDFFIIIGTSGIVYPAAAYGDMVSLRGVPIAEFNLDKKSSCVKTRYYFQGKAGELLPKHLLNI